MERAPEKSMKIVSYEIFCLTVIKNCEGTEQITKLALN